MYADTLSWGHGPRTFEVFLEPTCPFSVKAFNKLDDLLTQAGPDRITLKIRLQSQPWHLFSGVVVRCVLAAATLEGGKDSAKAVLAAVAAHREEFEFTDHATGPNRDATPNDIIARLEGYSGLALADAFANPDLQHAIKWHCKPATAPACAASPRSRPQRQGPFPGPRQTSPPWPALRHRGYWRSRARPRRALGDEAHWRAAAASHRGCGNRR